MRGKKICNTLKKVRLDIARANGIDYEVTECPHKGDCLGTCPKCESEVRYLERELEKRRKSGAKVAIAGVSAGLLAISAVGCTPPGTTTGLTPSDDYTRYEQESASTEMFVTQGSLTTSPESDTEVIEIDGDMPMPDTESMDIPGELIEPEELQGAVPEYPEDLVLEGDIAFVPETDKEEPVLEGFLMPDSEDPEA